MILTEDHEILKPVIKPRCKYVIGSDSYTVVEFYKKK